MRALAWVLLLGLAGVVACGKSEGDGGAAVAGASATAGASTAGSTSSDVAGKLGASGASSQAGSAGTTGAAGSTSGEGEPGGTAQGGSAHAGSAAQGGVAHAGGVAGAADAAGASGSAGAAALVDCDPRKILCKRATPVCSQGEVPSVSGTCYGECVKIETCACTTADECPQSDQYTCWMQRHCGPFVR